jgi:DNA-binding transcriptional regulator YdaS (Cro superfamily)
MTAMTLREYLKAKGLSRSAFARQFGVEHSTVSRWADGITQPSLQRAIEIEAATEGAVRVADLARQEPAS